ncbi:MAG: ISL3 family transposase [bacterium]
MVIPQFILPTNVQLKAGNILFNSEYLYIKVLACQLSSVCPVCNKTSFRTHSKYKRKLADLPVSGKQVRIELIARKYFCDNPVCSRIIFTERFSFEIIPYGRRLCRSNELLGKISLELGGNKGSTISRYMGIPISASTALRIIKGIEVTATTATSGIIGVDDWAFKKASTYGTIIVDLVSKEVIDLLPDREADTLAQWLKGHPEITVVSRDRSSTYAMGIRNGAPQARQVADRFHLLMNLGEATKKVFQAKGKDIREAYNLFNNPENLEPEIEEEKQDPELVSEENQVIPDNINFERLYKFEKVKELHQAGYPIRKIHRTLKIHRQTVKRYIDQETLQRKESPRSTNIEPFIEFLLQECNRDKTYKELHQTIRNMGFNGGYTQFCNNMNRLWQMQFPANPRRKNSVPLAPLKTWSPTKLSVMLYKDPEQLTGDDAKFMNLMLDKDPQINQMEKLVKKFKVLFLEKKDGLLKEWIDEASQSESRLQNFAKNLLKDFEAVNNAVITPYSNGQVEGQVNRLKNIKRMMYGRASFELLRNMVLIRSG